MAVRGLIAASCVVLALATPARAEAADDCTSELRESVTEALLAGGDPPYPIVERHPDGSITIHPQNVEPAVGHSVGTVLAYPGLIGGAVVTWVECVD